MDRQIHLLKTNESGLEDWSRIFGENGSDFGKSIIQNFQGEYIIVGYKTVYNDPPNHSYPSTYDIFLSKRDVEGNELWNQVYGGDIGEFENQYYTNELGFSVIESYDEEGYMLLGTKDYGNLLLIKTDLDGIEQWSHIFEQYQVELYNLYNGSVSLISTSDYCYLILATIEVEGERLILLTKIDNAGNQIWGKIYEYNSEGCYNDSKANSIEQTSDGGYIITGTVFDCEYYTSFNTLVIKVNSNGEEQWSNHFGSLWTDNIGMAIEQSPDGGYIVVGYNASWMGESAEIIKIDSYGNEQWVQEFDYEKFIDIKLTSDNRIVVLGKSTEYPDDQSYLIKFINIPSYGDINSDGFINIFDIILLVECILSDECINLDINSDGLIDVLDVVALITIILSD